MNLLTEMSTNPTFIFIDGSYFCFYRYHSLLTWWKNAYPEEADVFKFEFTKDGEEYGTVYVTLDDERVLTVYFGDDVSDSPGDKTPGLDYDDTWSGLLHQLSSWRMTKGLRGFKTQNKDRVSDDMARRNHMRNKDKIAEGYYATGKKSSYSDAVPSVKIVI